MSILHHTTFVQATPGISVDAQIADRLYFWNTSSSKWPTVYFKVIPGYTDVDDTSYVLPVGQYAFVDTVDNPTEIIYSASLLSPVYVKSIDSGSTTYWLRFSIAGWYFYGTCAGNVPEDVGDHVYTIRLFGKNSRNETAFQDFNITLRRTA